MPPSNRITISASVAIRCTSTKESSEASRSETSEATAADNQQERRGRQADPGGDDTDEDRDRQAARDDKR